MSTIYRCNLLHDTGGAYYAVEELDNATRYYKPNPDLLQWPVGQ